MSALMPDPADNVTVVLTPAEVIECCTERALAKIGEITNTSWSSRLRLRMRDGALDAIEVDLSHTKPKMILIKPKG